MTYSRFINLYYFTRKCAVLLAFFVIGYITGNAYPTFKVIPITENELPDTLAPIVGDLKEFNDKMEEK